MIRILLVSGTIPPEPCGVGDYTYMLARALAAIDGATVAILTGSPVAGSREKRDRSIEGIEIISAINSWRPRELPQALSAIKEWRPDVVHVQYPTQGYKNGFLPHMLPLAARMLGFATVQTWHEGFGRRQTSRFLLQLAARSRVIVVRSNFLDMVHPWFKGAIARLQPTFIANASPIPRIAWAEEALREEKSSLLRGQKRLVLFFGFLYPAKGVELLFDVADPDMDHLLIAGPAEPDSPYRAMLESKAQRPEWRGKVTFTGFITPERASLFLTAADAVVLPFKNGGGHWNTSLHSAISHGASVITTSTIREGYDESNNVFYARPDEVGAIRSALATYGRRKADADTCIGSQANDEWNVIARAHYVIYEKLIACRRAHGRTEKALP